MAPSGRFEDLGIPIRKAGFKGCIVAPDRTGEKDILYFNFNQTGDRLFLLAVDPDTGNTSQYLAPEGPGAWGYILAPDGKIYLGTWDGGLILCFNPSDPDSGIRVLGKPSETESYIWMFAIGGDGRLYGGTYGNAKLISYDTKTGEMRDLGRMDETQMYSRTVAAGKDGRIYIGIGSAKGDIVVYDPYTGKHGSIVPQKIKSKAKSGSTRIGNDGHAYAMIAEKWYRCEDSNLIPVPDFPGAVKQRFRDGRVLEDAGNGYYVIRHPNGEAKRSTFSYTGTGVRIFHVANGPLGRVYGSSVMPLELFEYDPKKNRLRHLGNPTEVNGEIYSMAVLDEKLYVCAYPGSWLSVYDPRKPWSYGTSNGSNPRGIGYAGDGHLRPRAMVVGPEGQLYIGSLPPYGEHGGAMGVYDPGTDGFVENYRHLIPNQSIVTLACDRKSRLIFGGSSINGGGGTKPIEKEARIFAWDPVEKRKILDLVPVKGDSSISSMTVFDGSVFAVSIPSNTLFRFDHDDCALKVIQNLPRAVPDLCLMRKGERMYGLTGSSVFEFEPASEKVKILGNYGGPINAGFALNDSGLYFGSGAHFIRYIFD